MTTSRLGLSRRTLAAIGAAFVPAALLPGVARAAAYPDRPIRIIMGFTPGGPNDLIARVVAQKMSASLGVQVLVEPHPGADSIIGTNLLAHAAPDGYTLGLLSSASTIHGWVYKSLPYDLLRDLTPVAILAQGNFVVLVNPSEPIHTLQELMTQARKDPDRFNCAGIDIGDTLHLSSELLQAMGGFKMTLIPYHGGAPALTALMGGETQVMVSPISIAAPQVKQGTVRALAVSGPSRDPTLPDVPTVAESGLPGYEVTGWYGLAAPAHTPPEVVLALNRAVEAALAMPDVAATLQTIALRPVQSSPDQARSFIEREIAKWQQVVAQAKIPAKSF